MFAAQVKIQIVQKSWSKPLGQHPYNCRACGARTTAFVLHEYTSVHLGEIPLFSFGSRFLHACDACRARNQGPRPTGAPGLPFMHRFGALVVFGIPLAIFFGVQEGNRRLTRWESAKAAERARPLEARAAELRASAERLLATLQQRKTACLGLMTLRPDTRTARPPTDPRLLEGAPTYSVSPLATTGRYFGPALDCEHRFDPPAELVRRFDLNGLHFWVEEPELGRTRARLEEIGRTVEATERALPALPPVVAVVSQDFPSQQKVVATATWIQSADGGVLAVARTEEVWGSEAWRLGTLLSQAAERWAGPTGP